MFLGAGLVLSGCGDDDTATTPAPAPPPPPAPAPDPEPDPEPEKPATPTGLHVDETTATSITWHWNAVEGATAYVVQASGNETFGDADDMTDITLMTQYTAEVPPNTAVYLRVAAAIGTSVEDAILSDWSTHVTGMSNAPPPPPPPMPDPVMVMFMAPDGEYPMVPDGDDDEATAMAMVNTGLMVSSNTTAVITPMFVDGATGVSVAAGDNMPFTYVDWGLMQSMVLSEGATFMVQRTVMGANQEHEPTGDVAYVTCGPFECMEGMDAPEISIANSPACTGWDPMVDIQVGKVDNDVLPDADAGDGNTNADDGVDLGIVTSSSLGMTVTHIFSGVAGGVNSETKTTAAKGSNKALQMTEISGVTLVDGTGDDSTMACDDNYDAGDITDKPSGCFRLIGPGAMGRSAGKGPDYLSGWSLKLTPSDAGVTWGRVNWDDDPFEDLTCDSTSMMVADHVDICSMFEAEVDYAIGSGWTASIDFHTDNNQINKWTASAGKSGGMGKMFRTVWFDNDLDGKITPMNDLYDHAGREEANKTMISKSFLDADNDPTAGDLGKVDLVSDKNDEATADVDEMTEPGNPDGMADNYLAGSDQADVRKCSAADGGDDDDGTLCDAVWSTDAEVLFADGTFGCTTTRMVSITCTWDADGGMAVGRNALPTNFDPDTNVAHFLSCKTN